MISSFFPSLKNLLLLTLLFAASTTTANSFVLKPITTTTTTHNINKNKNKNNNRPSTTTLYLEDWIADMIDGELHRQAHKKEYENEWMEKNRAAVFSRMESDFVMVRDDNRDFVMHKKDERLAKKDPQKYCADRCISTGNCDVYEDFFEMSPEQVIEFCTECVLSEEEEECQIPDGFYDKLMP